MHKRENQKAKDQRGMVSIIVTMIIMVVLSLVVLGFAQIARREQRQALDRQLNAQAFYAAESGINDARAAIANGYKGNKDECGPDETFDKNVIDLQSGVEYTCLLIDQTPEKLNYTISAGDSKYAYMEFVDSDGNPANVTHIGITWESDGSSPMGAADNSEFSELPSVNNWNDDGITRNSLLRLTLTELKNSDYYSRENLNKYNTTWYLYPIDNRSNVVFPFTSPDYSDTRVNQGKMDKAACNPKDSFDISKGYSCTIIIVNLDTPDMFIRLNAIYSGANVKITAHGGVPGISSSTNLSIKGAQAVVDVTGKANDVIRRVQATIPLAGFNGTSTFEGEDYAVQSVTGICKLLNVAPDFGSDGSCP